MKDSDKNTNDNTDTRTKSVLERNVKAYFDCLKTDEFIGVEIKNGVAHIVMA